MRKQGYFLEQMDNELLLYSPGETRIMQFNTTASLIWSLCNGERSLDEIIALLNDLYPEAGDSIPDDVHSTVETFNQLGCIEWQ